MHSAGSLPEIVDDQVGPIFAKTIREHSLIQWTPAQVKNRLSRRLNTTNCLHRRSLASSVPHPHLNGAVGIFDVKLHDIDKIGSVAESAAGDRQLSTGPKRIVELRFGNRMRGITTR